MTANHLVREESVQKKETYEQLSLFTDYEAEKKETEAQEEALEKEKRLQKAMLDSCRVCSEDPGRRYASWAASLPAPL